MTANIQKLKQRVLSNLWPKGCASADFLMNDAQWPSYHVLHEYTPVSGQRIDNGNGGVFYVFKADGHFYIAAKKFTPSDSNLIYLLEDENIKAVCVDDFYPNKDQLFLCAIYNLQVGFKSEFSSEMEIDNVMAPFSLPGATLSDLIDLLEDFYVFECDPTFDSLIGSDGRLLAFYFSTYNNYLADAIFSDQTVDRIRLLVVEDHPHFPYQNLIHSIFNNKIEYCFLEIYKCMELVFSIPRIVDLRGKLEGLFGSKIRSDCSIKDLAIACSQQLGWRRVERDSIKKLMSICLGVKPGIFDIAIKAFSGNKSLFNMAAVDNESALDSFVTDYYFIRNQIAHQFWDDDVKSISREEYDALIFFTAEAISVIYQECLKPACTS